MLPLASRQTEMQRRIPCVDKAFREAFAKALRLGIPLQIKGAIRGDHFADEGIMGCDCLCNFLVGSSGKHDPPTQFKLLLYIFEKVASNRPNINFQR